MTMFMDDMTKSRIRAIMAKAMEHAEEAMEDHNWEKAWKLVDIMEHCDHICRKHWELEHAHPEMMH